MHSCKEGTTVLDLIPRHSRLSTNIMKYIPLFDCVAKCLIWRYNEEPGHIRALGNRGADTICWTCSMGPGIVAARSTITAGLPAEIFYISR